MIIYDRKFEKAFLSANSAFAFFYVYLLRIPVFSLNISRWLNNLKLKFKILNFYFRMCFIQ